jgi:phosphoenolpyruvate carboxylase
MRLGRLNRLALEKRALKQDAIGAIDAALAMLLESDLTPSQCRDVLVFRAEWQSIGLGLARLHFRLNSVQLHNAIRPDIALSAAPGESPSRRHFLAAVTQLLDNVTPVSRASRPPRSACSCSRRSFRSISTVVPRCEC